MLLVILESRLVGTKNLISLIVILNDVKYTPDPRCRGNLRVGRHKFSELVKLLERNDFKVVKEKGSVRYYGKEGFRNLIRVDYHGSREVPTGTCNAILKAADLKGKGEQ